MEAKDTVITRFDLVQKYGSDVEGEYYDKVLKPQLEVQAKISFEAGISSMFPLILQYFQTISDYHYKIGISEVVEWINNNTLPAGQYGLPLCSRFFLDDWQKQLKEWGVNEQS